MSRKPRVNWVEAKKLYLSDSRNSYSTLAEMYGVSKATIQKRGTSDGWGKERDVYLYEALDRKLEAIGHSSVHEVNAQHLRLLKLAQAEAYKLLLRAKEQSDAGKLKKASLIMSPAINMLTKSIKLERKILGISPILKLRKQSRDTKVSPWDELLEQIKQDMRDREMSSE